MGIINANKPGVYKIWIVRYFEDRGIYSWDEIEIPPGAPDGLTLLMASIKKDFLDYNFAHIQRPKNQYDIKLAQGLTRLFESIIQALNKEPITDPQMREIYNNQYNPSLYYKEVIQEFSSLRYLFRNIQTKVIVDIETFFRNIYEVSRKARLNFRSEYFLEHQSSAFRNGNYGPTKPFPVEIRFNLYEFIRSLKQFSLTSEIENEVFKMVVEIIFFTHGYRDSHDVMDLLGVTNHIWNPKTIEHELFDSVEHIAAAVREGGLEDLPVVQDFLRKIAIPVLFHRGGQYRKEYHARLSPPEFQSLHRHFMPQILSFGIDRIGEVSSKIAEIALNDAKIAPKIEPYSLDLDSVIEKKAIFAQGLADLFDSLSFIYTTQKDLTPSQLKSLVKLSENLSKNPYVAFVFYSWTEPDSKLRNLLRNSKLNPDLPNNYRVLLTRPIRNASLPPFFFVKVSILRTTLLDFPEEFSLSDLLRLRMNTHFYSEEKDLIDNIVKSRNQNPNLSGIPIVVPNKCTTILKVPHSP